MPPEMAISMRHTKLTAAEAAMLAGEVQKPSWQSTNEGIHERVSFEDAIWGFDLAGGSFYKTPLRVVGVKPDSRAEKAGIRPGDKLLRINDIDTSTLSIQEAHEIIIESGIHLKIAVTAPEDEEDAYFCYEDPLDTGYDSEEERRLEEERARKRQVHAKVSSYWSLQWPWVSKRKVIYRESNCFMVPSKYEGKHRDKFSVQPMIRTQDDVVLDSIQSKKETLGQVADSKLQNELEKETAITNGQSSLTNGTNRTENVTNGTNQTENVTNGTNQTENVTNGTNDTESAVNGVESNIQGNGIKSLPEISEKAEESIKEESEMEETNENSVMEEDTINEVSEIEETNENSVMDEESIQEEVLEEEEVSELESEVEEKSQIESSEATEDHDEVIKKVLDDHDISADEEDKILNSILSNGETSESMDER